MHELNAAAARIAREVADASGRKVAGRRAPWVPTGEIFEPVGSLSPSRRRGGLRRAGIKGSRRAAPIVLWIETISSEEELRAAVEGAATAGLPIVATMSFDTAGRTMMGITPQAFGELAREPRPPAGGDRRQLWRRRGRAHRHRARHHGDPARRHRRRQGQLRYPGICRRPYPLFRHARAHGRLCPSSRATPARGSSAAAAAPRRSIWSPCGRPSRTMCRATGPPLKTVIARLGDVSNLARGEVAESPCARGRPAPAAQADLTAPVPDGIFPVRSRAKDSQMKSECRFRARVWSQAVAKKFTLWIRYFFVA